MRHGPWLIALVALLARGYHLLLYRDALPFWDGPIGDAEVYHALASDMAEGDWLPPQLTYRPFLYPLFLGSTYALLGPTPTMAFLVQALFGVGTVVLGGAIARRVYGPSAGLCASALLALYGPLTSMDAKLLDTSLSVFLHTASLWALLAATRVHHGLGAGLLAGLAALARPPLLVVAALGLGWLALQRRRAAVLGALIGVLLPLSLGSAVQQLTTGGFSPLSRNGGATFYAGNNPRARGDYSVPPGFSGDPRAQESEEQRLGTSAFSLGLSWVRAQPADATRTTLLKLWRFFMADEAPLEYDYEREREAVPVLYALAIPFSVLGVLALLGAALAWRAPTTWLLLAALLTHLAVALVFYVSSRYRVAAAPVCAILAAGALIELGRRLRAGQRRLVAVIATIVAGATVALAVNPLDDAETRAALAAFNEGVSAERLGDFRAAQASLIRAVARNPRLVEGWLELGNTLARIGRFPEARRAYAQILVHMADHPRAHLSLGISYLRQPRPDYASAKPHLARAEGSAPSADSALYLSQVLRAQGDLQGARRMLLLSVERDSTGAQAWNSLGMTEWALAERARPVDGAALARAVRAFDRGHFYGSAASGANLMRLRDRYRSGLPSR